MKRIPPKKTPPKNTPPKKTPELDTKARLNKIKTNNKPSKRPARPGGRILKQNIDKDLTEYTDFISTFTSHEQSRLINKAKTFSRSIHSQAGSALQSLDRMREAKVKHVYELHTKYTMATVCFIFLFIGAPMGAIVRKGGFGYPILVSIIFFMIFVVLTIFCKKIAESFVLPADVAAWVPCMILFPIGIILTYKAMNDSKLVNVDRYTAFFARVVKWIKARQKNSAIK